MKAFFCHYNMLLLLLLGAVTTLISGCCTQQKLGTSSLTERSGEIRVETYIEYRIDTMYIDIPSQMAEKTTRDSISYLENDYAISEARINIDGSLFHSLNTKSQKKAIEFQKPIERKDSIRTEYIYTNTEIPIEVERELTFWEATCIRLFPWSVALLVLTIGLYFRKPIWNIVRFFGSFYR